MEEGRELVPGVIVSRETIERLSIYESILKRWQSKINLVSAATLPVLWSRHFGDSAQILDCAPSAKVWADLGTGAGFPGVVMAIQLREIVGGRVHLIESDAKKCAFLREVVRETGASAEIHRGRIEAILPELTLDALTARALAPMVILLDYATPLLMKGAIGVFLKGQDVGSELTKVPASSRFLVNIRPSHSDPSGRIVIVRASSEDPQE